MPRAPVTRTYSKKPTVYQRDSVQALNALLADNLQRREICVKKPTRKTKAIEIRELPLPDENHHLIADSFERPSYFDNTFDKLIKGQTVDSVLKQDNSSEAALLPDDSNQSNNINDKRESTLDKSVVDSLYIEKEKPAKDLTTISSFSDDSNLQKTNSNVENESYIPKKFAEPNKKCILASTPALTRTPVEQASILNGLSPIAKRSVPKAIVNKSYDEIHTWSFKPPAEFEPCTGTTPKISQKSRKGVKKRNCRKNKVVDEKRLKAIGTFTKDYIIFSDKKLNMEPRVLINTSVDILGISCSVKLGSPNEKVLETDNTSSSQSRTDNIVHNDNRSVYQMCSPKTPTRSIPRRRRVSIRACKVRKMNKSKKLHNPKDSLNSSKTRDLFPIDSDIESKSYDETNRTEHAREIYANIKEDPGQDEDVSEDQFERLQVIFTPIKHCEEFAKDEFEYGDEDNSELTRISPIEMMRTPEQQEVESNVASLNRLLELDLLQQSDNIRNPVDQVKSTEAQSNSRWTVNVTSELSRLKESELSTEFPKKHYVRRLYSLKDLNNFTSFSTKHDLLSNCSTPKNNKNLNKQLPLTRESSFVEDINKSFANIMSKSKSLNNKSVTENSKINDETRANSVRDVSQSNRSELNSICSNEMSFSDILRCEQRYDMSICENIDSEIWSEQTNALKQFNSFSIDCEQVPVREKLIINEKNTAVNEETNSNLLFTDRVSTRKSKKTSVRKEFFELSQLLNMSRDNIFENDKFASTCSISNNLSREKLDQSSEPVEEESRDSQLNISSDENRLSERSEEQISINEVSRYSQLNVSCDKISENSKNQLCFNNYNTSFDETAASKSSLGQDNEEKSINEVSRYNSLILSCDEERTDGNLERRSSFDSTSSDESIRSKINACQTSLEISFNEETTAMRNGENQIGNNTSESNCVKNRISDLMKEYSELCIAPINQSCEELNNESTRPSNNASVLNNQSTRNEVVYIKGNTDCICSIVIEDNNDSSSDGEDVILISDQEDVCDDVLSRDKQDDEVIHVLSSDEEIKNMNHSKERFPGSNSESDDDGLNNSGGRLKLNKLRDFKASTTISDEKKPIIRKTENQVFLKNGKWRRSLLLLRKNSLQHTAPKPLCTSIRRTGCWCSCENCLDESHKSPQKEKLSRSIFVKSALSTIRQSINSSLLELTLAGDISYGPNTRETVFQNRTVVGEPHLELTRNNSIYEETPNERAKTVVLRKCGQEKPIPFKECYSDTTLGKCRKIGEGVYGEVFLYKNSEGSGTVMKIIPIEGNQLVNDEPQKKFSEILSEIVIAMELSNLRKNSKNNTSGFSELRTVKCVQGRYPEKLLDLWDLYDETRKSENDSPEMFGDDQLYIILEFANGGSDMESFVFKNADEAFSLFKQISWTLAVAEQALEFEHRDLHWGNILIARTDKNKVLRFCLNGREFSMSSNGIEVSIIDFTLSRAKIDSAIIYNDISKDPDLFTATGEYQFEIYKLMQQKNNNEWELFEAYTNVLWMHYVIHKMITALRYTHTTSKLHKNSMRKMMQLEKYILTFNSVNELVTNQFIP